MSSTRSGAPARSTTTPGQGASRVAASKSRSDKSRTVTVAPIPQVSVDVIPGRFTEDDWLSLVATEDGEEVVGEIVDSLMSRVMEECYKVYLERQLIPYSISQALDAMIQMVQWTFIPRDEGDDETYPEQTWQEEPQPCPNDSWAQGCVPIIQPVPTARSGLPQASSEYPITSIPEHEAETEPQEVEISTSPNPEEWLTSSQELEHSPKEETKIETPVTEMSPLAIKPTPPPEPPKNKTRYRPYRGPLRSAGLRNITKSLEETEQEMLLDEFMKVKEEDDLSENVNLLPTSLHNILKIQLGRPPQKKDVIYDEAGTVLSVPKLVLAKLPQLHVRPHIEVLDSSREAECRVRKPSRVDVRTTVHQLQRERRVRDKEQLKQSQDTRQKYGPLSYDSQTLQAFTGSTRTDYTKDLVPTTGGIILDNIQLSHGVILQQGNMTERGSAGSLQQRELAWREGSRQLQPIRSSVTLPSLSVEQLIKDNVPQVHQLVSFMPS